MTESHALKNNRKKCVTRRTTPMSPSVAENMDRIWIVGSNHVINLSSPLEILFNA
jgi:hypothetical protein